MNFFNMQAIFSLMRVSSEMTIDRPIPSEFAIQDITQMLARVGILIDTQENVHEYNVENRMRINWMKWKIILLKCFFIISLIIFGIKFLILTQIDTRLESNRKWIFYLGDISILVSGMREFILFGICSISIASIYKFYKFSFTKKTQLPWLKLFQFLDGNHAITPRQMGLTDVEIVKAILKRYFILLNLSLLSVISGTLLGGLIVSIEGYILFRNIEEALCFILWIVYYDYTTFLISTPLLASINVLYLCCFYLQARLKSLNDRLDRILEGPLMLRKFVIKYETRCIIHEHNSICASIAEHNSFFTQIYSIALFISMPLTLIALNLILFTKTNAFTKMMYSLFIIGGWTFIFWIGLFLALVHEQARRTYKKICKLQWRFENFPLTTRMKIQSVMVERIGCEGKIIKKVKAAREIGFRINGLFVVTLGVMFRVS
jgi:hypothetical protein